MSDFGAGTCDFHSDFASDFRTEWNDYAGDFGGETRTAGARRELYVYTCQLL